MGRLRVFALLSVLIAASFAAGSPAPALAKAAPVTAFVWDGSDGGAPGLGIDDTFRPGEDGVTITVSGTSSGVTAHLDAANPVRRMPWAEIRLFPPKAGHLTAGTYDNAVEAFYGPVPQGPGMWIAANSSACGMRGGRFVVDEATYDPASDAVQSFAATFQVGCNEQTVFGNVRFNSAVSFASRHGGLTVVPFMADTAGGSVDRMVTVTSDGSAALQTGQLTLTPPAAAARFSIVDDRCSHASLPRGGACQLTVRYHALDTAEATATLTLPDNAARGARSWTLDGAVSAGPPPPGAPDPSAPPASATTAVFVDRSFVDMGRIVHTFRDGQGSEKISVAGDAYGAFVGVTWVDPNGYSAQSSINIELTPAKGGDTLVAGRDYVGATRWPFHQGAEPGLDVGFGCNTSAGSFSIFDIGYDAQGKISRLAAAWLNACTGVAPEAGEVRWHSTVPLASRAVDPDRTSIGYYLSDGDRVTRATVTVTSKGSGPLAIGAAEIDGADADAYLIAGDTCSGTSLPPGTSCTLTIDYVPADAGTHGATLVIPDNTAMGGIAYTLYGTAHFPAAAGDPAGSSGIPGRSAGRTAGYWMVGSDGAVYAFGDARPLGNAPVGSATAVDLEPTPTGAGYWIVDDLGRVFPFGDAVAHGNVDRTKLAAGEKTTSLSATPTGAGYWIFTDRGRVLTFGDATSFGDVSNLHLAGPVLDSIVTPSGKGYYMVASDGGIFAFGDATFYGSMGGKKLNAPVQSLVPDSDGVGYWLVASDGGIFAFQADFKGSMGGVRLNRPITGMVPAGAGYLMVGEDGGIFDFSGDPASFKGSLSAHPPARPITSVAVLATGP